MTKFEEELKETYEKVSINLYGNNAGSIGMKKLLNELKDTGLLKEQQALPVVPEVSEHIHNWISKRKMWELMQDDYDPEIEELKELKEKLNLHDIEETIAWLKINEYTVEKPQLFYLVNTLTRQYLYRRDKVSFGEQDYCKDCDDKPLAYCLFTQQEIDSMQTGSYEQIKVEEEK